ncbi:hypothetical protein E5Q_02638 [Mixia osmundae IAM 14324]|uniref:Uncharacterized protein n=1 Tax=Mixia osmundae (strain CBS 9802 / IAM 14324 / JCM 22182 / KY 12970) TaxID=764103 RepID=G7DZH0_MIXOS|nr:hypothetical protein E5Q_02638 [Mixia osmundae IAM 14324]
MPSEPSTLTVDLIHNRYKLDRSSTDCALSASIRGISEKIQPTPSWVYLSPKPHLFESDVLTSPACAVNVAQDVYHGTFREKSDGRPERACFLRLARFATVDTITTTSKDTKATFHIPYHSKPGNPEYRSNTQ